MCTYNCLLHFFSPNWNMSSLPTYATAAWFYEKNAVSIEWISFDFSFGFYRMSVTQKGLLLFSVTARGFYQLLSLPRPLRWCHALFASSPERHAPPCRLRRQMVHNSTCVSSEQSDEACPESYRRGGLRVTVLGAQMRPFPDPVLMPRRQ